MDQKTLRATATKRGTTAGAVFRGTILLTLADLRPTGLRATASTLSLTWQGEPLQIFNLKPSEAHGGF